MGAFPYIPVHTRYNMNNPSITIKDGQAPARRIGGAIAVLVLLVGLACMCGIWYFFAGESVNQVIDSVRLQSSGVTTTGTVVDVEEHSTADPSDPGTRYTYRLTISFDVDGTSHTFQSNAIYHALDHSWGGETMPVIYEPEDPNVAMINTFRERWFEPVLNAWP